MAEREDFRVRGPAPGPSRDVAPSLVSRGLALTVTALAAAIPRAQLGPLVKTHGLSLAIGAAVGVGAWVAGQASSVLWWPFGPMTLRAVGFVLGLVLDDPVSEPSEALVGSERFPIEVLPACSGFEGIGMITAFAGTYLLLARRQLRFPQALLLLPLGVATAWVANVVRLVLLVLVGTWFSEDVALNGFHAKAGWLFFCGVAFSLVLVVQRARFFAQAPSEGGRHPAAPYLLPFLVLVAASLLTGLFSSHLDLLYGVRALAVLPVLFAFRRSYGDVSWRGSWSAVAAGLLAAAIFVALAPRSNPETLRAWEEEWGGLPAAGRALWLALRVFGSVLIVPVAEELAFRGYLLRRLQAREFLTLPFERWTPWAVLVSSAAFGAIHAGWLGGALAGLLFAIVQIRGRSLTHAVLAHVVSNAAVAIYVIGGGRWWLWI